MSLLSVDQARARILSRFQPVTIETLSLAGCSKRVLAQDISAPNDLPPFDNSSMDGFAVRSADVADATTDSPRSLSVVADIPAGSQPTIFLKAGEAARIMTGAPVPQGADVVIPVEDTGFNDRDAGTPAPDEVQVFRPAKAGWNIRPRGMDILSGEIVLYKGRILKPQDIGLLAMLGFATVGVFRRPRVALFSSGDELLPAEAPLQEGKIRDSNSYTLAALLEDAGTEVIRLGVARDNHDSVLALLEQAVDLKVDMILSSAGVSVGAFDFVKQVIESNGSMDFWRVNMRPGKPVAFGDYKKIPIIGLPGNPVSAFGGFEVFVRAALGRLRGVAGGNRQTVRVRCAEQIDSDGRESYLR
ncbi:MAG TPA: gephyrin-like molybdotransferase Glp, partial [Anaerolineales bacterium]|nr:gephyrin-like molybdotransferase Glp [Anaerolineales bacterium]